MREAILSGVCSRCEAGCLLERCLVGTVPWPSCKAAAKWLVTQVYLREPGMPPGHYLLQWDTVYIEGLRRGKEVYMFGYGCAYLCFWETESTRKGKGWQSPALCEWKPIGPFRLSLSLSWGSALPPACQTLGTGGFNLQALLLLGALTNRL